ncbi:hypothetical protein BS639_08880 [Rouxiella silvae]|uniref:Uncharacterized protein n=1 Tax=Rouxiella silvae TaxID=1646373 RepID=A0ABX3U280_9GAMM|nr:hypothetical protein [Rouxiella silvae]ORJ21570.1 hypothetical protein BS639_08880 [Rouxiella silvae]
MAISTQLPSLSSLLVNHQRQEKWAQCGFWMEMPNGRKFVADPNAPYTRAPGQQNQRPRWFAKLMGIFF